MPKTTKVLTLQVERADYSEAVTVLQGKIETVTGEIYASEDKKFVSLSCTSATKNHFQHPSHVLTAFILIEVDVEEDS
jgi:hypothetical protein